MLGATPLRYEYRPGAPVSAHGGTQPILEAIWSTMRRAWDAILGRVPIVGGPAEAERYGSTFWQGYGLPWAPPHGRAENVMYQDEYGTDAPGATFWHPSMRSGMAERQGVGDWPNIFAAGPWLMVGAVVILGGTLVWLWKSGEGDFRLKRNPTRGTPRKVTRYYYETLPYARKRFRSKRRAKQYAARVAWTRYKKYGKRKRRSR